MHASGTDSANEPHYDAIVVGAGFAGLYALHRLRELGFHVHGYEEGPDVGGTWFWNRYPGARCDVESAFYSYSFSPELEQAWRWSERFASQHEILSYLRHVAERFDLRRSIAFNTRIVRATYNAENRHWTCTTIDGKRVVARFCIMATGCLSASKTPAFKGIETFPGNVYQTSRWPADGVDFSGRRVGVIGTGSTGIQVVPAIAEQAARLFVFQRTPAYSMPARNHPIGAAADSAVKSLYRELREAARTSMPGFPIDVPTKSAMDFDAETRERTYETIWREGSSAFGVMFAYKDLLTNNIANETVAEFVRGKIRKTVKDPAVAERLLPKMYPMGARRVCLDSGYYETFNRENVELVDISAAPIEEVLPAGIRTRESTYALDAIVLAIGFDSMTGALLGMDIRGRHGVTLRQCWSTGPRTFLGLCAAEFPNMFFVTGPGSPSVLSNMVVSIEHHVDWIADCLAHMRAWRLETVEASSAAQEAWTQHVNVAASMTLFPRAESWYLGANIPGKPRVFMPYVGGVGAYRRICADVARKGYEGLRFSASPSGATT